MPPRNRHTRTESVPHSDFGAQEFYDEDDLEELDEQADAGDLAAFDAEAIDEDEEARLLQMRVRATKGGQDDLTGMMTSENLTELEEEFA